MGQRQGVNRDVYNPLSATDTDIRTEAEPTKEIRIAALGTFFFPL
jgi:hypothetical protein